MSKYSKIKLDPYGVVYDTNPHDAPLESWTDVQNMRFNDGASEKFKGETLGTATTLKLLTYYLMAITQTLYGYILVMV